MIQNPSIPIRIDQINLDLDGLTYEWDGRTFFLPVAEHMLEQYGYEAGFNHGFSCMGGSPDATSYQKHVIPKLDELTPKQVKSLIMQNHGTFSHPLDAE